MVSGEFGEHRRDGCRNTIWSVVWLEQLVCKVEIKRNKGIFKDGKGLNISFIVSSWNYPFLKGRFFLNSGTESHRSKFKSVSFGSGNVSKIWGFKVKAPYPAGFQIEITPLGLSHMCISAHLLRALKREIQRRAGRSMSSDGFWTTTRKRKGYCGNHTEIGISI